MAATVKNGNAFWQKLLLAVISGAILLFFGWLSWTVVNIQVVSARMDERIVQLDRKITALSSAQAAQTARQVEENTGRLNAIEGNAQ